MGPDSQASQEAIIFSGLSHSCALALWWQTPCFTQVTGAATNPSPAPLSEPLAVPSMNSIRALLCLGTNELQLVKLWKQIFFVGLHTWLTDGRDTENRDKTMPLLHRGFLLKFLWGVLPRYQILWGLTSEVGAFEKLRQHYPGHKENTLGAELFPLLFILYAFN